MQLRAISVLALSVVLGFCCPLQADPPRFDAPLLVRGVRIVQAPQREIERGEILIRDGSIAAVGESVDAPPGTREIDCAGMVAYAGFVDGFNRLALSEASLTESEERRREGSFPAGDEGPLPATVEGNRAGIFARRGVQDLLDVSADTFAEARKAGFTSALLAPPRALFGGTAALLALDGGPVRHGLLRPDVAQTGSFQTPPRHALRVRGSYPATLMGSIAHLRQTLSDAQWYSAMSRYVAEHPDAAGERPLDADLEALQPLLASGDARRWLMFEANTRAEIERALSLGDEFGLRLMIAGGAEAGEVAALLATRGIPVMLTLSVPAEPTAYRFEPDKIVGKEDDVSLYGKNWGERPFYPQRVYEEAAAVRERRLRTAQQLTAAGVEWCFAGLDVKSADVLKNLRTLIKAGLSADAAIAALTLTPAQLWGMDAQLGTIDAGKLANITILSESIDHDDAAVRHVFVRGAHYQLDGGRKRGDKKTDRVADADDPQSATASQPATSSAPVSQPTTQTADAPAPTSGPTGAAASAPTSAPASAPLSTQPQSWADRVRAHAPAWELETDTDRVPALRTGGNVLLRSARVLTMAGEDLPRASVLVRDGKISAVGTGLTAPEGVTEIDLSGCVLMPGIFDGHSHIALDAVNEFSLSVTPEVRCEDVIDAKDPSIFWALTGGVTTIHAMHGSANTIGGQCVLLKLKYGKPARELVIPGSKRTVKWALGENVIRSGKTRSPFGEGPRRFPGSRMGVEAVLRRALLAGQEYAAARAARPSAGGADAKPLRRDLRLEALADILAGEIWVNTHCYRADEILRLLAVAEDFGIRVAVLHHVLEGYRIIPEIARHGAGTSTFSDWWAFKVESYDAVPHNAGMLLRGGVNSAIKSDSGEMMRHMNLEAAKCLKFGGVTPEEALRMITLNPARQFGLADRVGSIEVGKDADIAVFDAHPLDTFARCVLTLVEGEVYFQHRALRTTAAAQAGAGAVERAAAAAPSRSGWEAPRFPNDVPFALPAPAPAAPLDAPAYAITGATLHPVSGPPIPRGVLVIRNGRIEALGAHSTPPPDAHVIDASGLHVTPGLINAATHAGLEEIEAVDVTIDTAEPGTFQPDLMAISAFNPHSAMVEVARGEGITTIGLVPRAPTIPGQIGVLDLYGWTMNEMLRTPRAGLLVNLPVTRAAPIVKRSGDEERSENTALQRLERLMRDARLYAEAADAPGGLARRDARFEAMRPYVRGDGRIWLEANSYQAILEALLLADKLELRPVILGGRDAWKVADLLAERQIPVVYQGVFSMPPGAPETDRMSDVWDGQYRSLAVMEAAGVKFCVSYRGADLAKLMPVEVGFAVAHGLDEDAALRCMTLSAAEILGVGDELGSLERGKVANLIVTTDHPARATSVVKQMFIRGKPVPLQSKHTRDAERFEARPAPLLPPERTDLLGPPSQTLPAQR